MPLSDISNKFIVDDSTLLSFINKHSLKVDYPDSDERGKRKGVAVAYFLENGLIPPEVREVSILRPFYNEPPHDREDTINIYILAHYQGRVIDQHPVHLNFIDQGRFVDNHPLHSDFIKEIHKAGLTGVYSDIPVRPTYLEILAGWKQKMLEDQKKIGYLRSPRDPRIELADAEELRNLRLTHTDESRLP